MARSRVGLLFDYSHLASLDFKSASTGKGMTRIGQNKTRKKLNDPVYRSGSKLALVSAWKRGLLSAAVAVYRRGRISETRLNSTAYYRVYKDAGQQQGIKEWSSSSTPTSRISSEEALLRRFTFHLSFYFLPSSTAAFPLRKLRWPTHQSLFSCS